MYDLISISVRQFTIQNGTAADKIDRAGTSLFLSAIQLHLFRKLLNFQPCCLGSLELHNHFIFVYEAYL